MIGRESQIERLTFELNRTLKDGAQDTVKGVPARTALKLLDVCQGISITLADMLELSLLRVKQHETPDSDNLDNDEIFRSEMVTVSAAVQIESIISRVITRANENLAATKLMLMAQITPEHASINFDQQLSGLNVQLSSLRHLTKSYAEDLVVQRAAIVQYDTPQQGDSYIVKTQKEILQMLAVFAEAQMQKAIALVDIAINCPPRDQADFAKRSTVLAAFGITAATMAKFIVDMLGDAIAATGTICIAKPQLN